MAFRKPNRVAGWSIELRQKNKKDKETNGENMDTNSDKYYTDVTLMGKTRMFIWIDATYRCLKMATALFEFQQMVRPVQMHAIREYIEEKREDIYQRLDSIHLRYKRRTAHGKSAFLILFSLCNFLTSLKSFVILDKGVQFRFFNILIDLLHGPTFKNRDPTLFLRCLKSVYEIDTMNMSSLFRAWEKSPYFSETIAVASVKCENFDSDLLDNVYFGSFRAIVFKHLLKNLEFLPTIIELGQFNIRVFSDFLERFQIPFSGPYKKQESHTKVKVQYFVSSNHQLDYMFNNNHSFNGVFEFPLSALVMRTDIAERYVEKLPILPNWINCIAPVE